VWGQPHTPAASTLGIDPVPILQEAGWAPRPVWTGGKSRPHRDSMDVNLEKSKLLTHHNTVNFELLFSGFKKTTFLGFFSPKSVILKWILNNYNVNI